MTISTKTKNGLIIAIFSLGFYSPFAGYLTSYSAIAENLSTALNINNIYTSGLNSFAFALAVGSGPITTQFLTNKKFGFKWTTFAGFIIASLGLLAASFASKLWQIFLFYSVITSLGNNCVYMGLNYIVSEWLDGTKWKTPGCVLVSMAISTGVFVFNIVTIKLKDWTVGKYDPQDSSVNLAIVQDRFMAFSAIIFFWGIVFFILYSYLDKQNQQSEPQNEPQESEDFKKDEEKNNNKQQVEIQAPDFNNKIHHSLLHILMYLLPTFFWGVIFTVPYTLGTGLISSKLLGASKNNENSPEEIKTLTASILAGMGICELTIRFFVMLLGPSIPTYKKKGLYAHIYGIMCIVTAFICFSLTLNFQSFKWTAISLFSLFWLLTLPMAVMNSLVMPAGENIYNKKLNDKIIFPYGSSLLAFGFFAGPVVFEYLSDNYGTDTGFLVASIGVFGAGCVFVLLGLIKMKEHRQVNV